jgi:hypothetical protein
MRVPFGDRNADGRSGRRCFVRPHEDVALQDGHMLDLHQLVAELGECLRIERELPANRAQGYAPMPLQEGARPLDGVEEAHAPYFRSLLASRSSARNVVASTKSVKRIVPVGAPAGGVDIVSVVYCVGGVRGKVRRVRHDQGRPATRKEISGT